MPERGTEGPTLCARAAGPGGTVRVRKPANLLPSATPPVVQSSGLQRMGHAGAG